VSAASPSSPPRQKDRLESFEKKKKEKKQEEKVFFFFFFFFFFWSSFGQNVDQSTDNVVKHVSEGAEAVISIFTKRDLLIDLQIYLHFIIGFRAAMSLDELRATGVISQRRS
jgi:hypothetical protein